MRISFLLVLACVLTACGSSTHGSDASVDAAMLGDGSAASDASQDGASANDAASSDAGGTQDGATASDAGSDAGTDAGSDAGPMTCPSAPAGATAQQATALATVNATRLAIGAGCATMVSALNQASAVHCAYVTQNGANSACDGPVPPHSEVSTCAGYTGVTFAARDTAAGYAGSPVFEDMASANSPTASVAMWIDSIWHRTPILSPWIRDLGYGNTTDCDTMDFGVGATTAATVLASYPYAGQTGVPRSFDGSREGPTPPAPPAGWPSGYPITFYVKGLTAAEQGAITHTLTVNGQATSIAHQFLTPSANPLLSNDYVMYANVALAAATTYRVQFHAMRGATAVDFDFTFTTQ